MPESFKVDIIADATDVQNKITSSRAKLKEFQKQAATDATVNLRVKIATLKEDLVKVNADLRRFRKEGDENAAITAQLRAEGLRTQITEARKQLRGLETQVTSTTKSFFSLNGIVRDALKAFGGVFIVREFAQGLKSAFDASVSFESAFAGVRKTVDASEQEFQVLSDQFRQLAKEVPVAVEGLLGIGELAGQLGVAKEDIVDFTKTIASIAVSSNLTEEEAATSFARIANIFEAPANEVDRLASSVIELGNNFATTESEIVTFATRIAGTAKVVGLTQADIAAIGTAFTSVGVEAEAGGTAVQKALLAINDGVNSGGADLERFAQVAGVSATDFAQLWKTDAARAFDLFVQGLGDAGADATDILDELVAGDTRLTRAFLSVAGAGDLLTRAISTSSTAFEENNALSEEAAKRFETTESRLQLVASRFNDLKIQLGNTLKEFVLPFLEGMLDLAEALFANGEKMRGLATLIKVLGAAFTSYLGARALVAISNGIESINLALEATSLKMKTASREAKGFGAGLKALAAGITGVKLATGLLTAGIGLLITVIAVSIKRARELKQATADLRTEIENLKDLSIGIERLTEEFDATLAKVQELSQAIKDLNKVSPEQRADLFAELDPQRDAAIQELRDNFEQLGFAMGATASEIQEVKDGLKFFRRDIEPTKKDIEKMQDATAAWSSEFVSLRENYLDSVDRLVAGNGDLRSSVDQTVDAMRSGWLLAGRDVDKLSKNLEDTLIKRAANTEGIGEAFTTGFHLGVTKDEIVDSLQTSVGDITDEMLGTLLSAAVEANDRGEVFGLLYASGIDAESAQAVYATDDLRGDVIGILNQTAQEARVAGEAAGSNTTGGIIEGLKSNFPALNSIIGAVRKVLGAFGGFELFGGIAEQVPILGSAVSALKDLGNQANNVLESFTEAQESLKQIDEDSGPSFGGGGGGGGASDALREAEKAAKEAEDAVDDYIKAIEDTNEASEKLRDDIRDFYDDINDSIESAREKQAELNAELDDFKAEQTREFVIDTGKRDAELADDEKDIRQEIADLEAQSPEDAEEAARIAEEIAELQSDLNEILKERAQIQEYLNTLTEEQRDLFDQTREREGLTEFQQGQLALEDAIKAKEAEIQAEIDKQQRIIDIQEQFLAVQESNDQAIADARAKLYDIANGDVIATAEERAELLKQLGFEELSREEELELLKNIQRAEGLQRELEEVEAQQAELLAVKEEYFTLTEQAHADSVDNMKAKTQELIDIIKEAQIEQQKLNALQASSTSASAGGSGTTINQTNNNYNNVDAEIANQQLLDKI